MIKQTSLNFLVELKNNNSREWFEQNKILYQAYKDDIVQFTEQILSELSKIDLSIANTNLIPKKCLTRVTSYRTRKLYDWWWCLADKS